MRVTYVGFGGGYAEYPCYEDEKGKLYFDLNDGRGELDLYTGAYRDEDGEILGEPCSAVTESFEYTNPFVRHTREHDYMMLDRYRNDCEYFLGYGNGYEGHLYFKDVNRHCDEMKKLYDSFHDKDKPEWITAEQIEQYRTDMLELLNKKQANNHDAEQEMDLN